MKTSIVLSLALLVVAPGFCRGQFGGNATFSASASKGKAELREGSKHAVPEPERPPTGTSMFVDADVLMNVKADEYVAVFGLAQEGETVAECCQKMDATVKEFTEALKAIKIGGDDLFLDFVTQTKIYGFEVMGDIAKEKQVGFELKKNLSIRFTDKGLVDKLVIIAAQSKIYDLIKVDYVVKDVELVQEKLIDEATKVIQKKIARYDKLLGIKLLPPAQVYAEVPAAYYPTEMYDSYRAAETEGIEGTLGRRNYIVQRSRKNTTAYFNGLDGDGFDKVINPVIIEPVVQFTLHLKLKYEVEQTKAK
jgi:uncharacterized protein YggE